jgi:hypothetical protein
VVSSRSRSFAPHPPPPRGPRPQNRDGGHGDEKTEAQSRGRRVGARPAGEGSQEERKGEEDIARQVDTRPNAAQEELRRDALSAFLETKIADGYRVETRTGTQAIVAPTGARSLLGKFRRSSGQGRQVISVDDQGEVTVAPAEPLRS